MDFERLKTSLYTPEDVEIATAGRVAPNLLYQWRSQKCLVATLKPKAGRPLRFGLMQVWGLALLAEFRAVGVELERASAWARYFAGQWYSGNFKEVIAFDPRDESPNYVPASELGDFLQSPDCTPTSVAINVKRLALHICERLDAHHERGAAHGSGVTKQDIEQLYRQQHAA